MFAISSSYGNDSVALVQLASDMCLDLFDDVFVVFVDTGWAGEGWLDRVGRLEAWVRSLGFVPVRLKPATQFEDLMVSKKGFPNQQYQWCSLQLKALPFIQWLDKTDPYQRATVVIGKRREESRERKDTPEFVDCSEYHGNRRLWHPLFAHTETDRDALLHRAGVRPLPYRSQECAPCVNANRADLLLLSEAEIQRVEDLENEVGKTMFRPMRYKSKKYPNGCRGIREVIQWAHKAPLDVDSEPLSPCASGYCGL
jgi:3'-phosphoadenosine 5'-phosphosulfate sulfotransferase (PAPS reductase)/FAD synthetase